MNKEVDNATSPLVQELLQRTRENAADRQRKRLKDYYRRNFGDYFSFQAGNMKGLSLETQEQIKKWLQENTSSLPGNN